MRAFDKFLTKGLWNSIACWLSHATVISAATLVWDGNTSTTGLQDGAGNWNTSSTDRWYDQSASTYQVWNNTAYDIARFGALSSSTTSQTVTVSEPISLGGIEFAQMSGGSYTITGTATNRLNFEGDAPTIEINHTAATISAGISGTQDITVSASANTNLLHLNGSVANDFSGTLIINGGEVRLSKTAGVNAISGDVIISGGTLRWTAANQVADTASITLNSGILYIGGQTDTIKNLTLNGGTNNGGTSSNNATFTVTDTITVNWGTSLGLNSTANWTTGRLVLNAGSSTTDGLGLTGNNASKMATLKIGSGGLEIYARNITLNSGTDPGVLGSQIILNGDVISSGTTNIRKSGNSIGEARLNLETYTPQWDVLSGTTNVQVSIIGEGGLTKRGAGTLLLSSVDANTYTGVTTVEEGILKLQKNVGIDAIAGDVIVKAGAVLDWDQSHQLNDSTSIYLQGGTLDFSGKDEVFANLYQSSGSVNHNFDTNSANITITGLLEISGGNSINLNSTAQWSVNEFRATSAKTGDVITLNGDSASKINRFTIGSGGISLQNNQNIALAKSQIANGFGSEMVLQGDFTANGTVNLNVTRPTGNGVAQVNLASGQRTFDIQSGTTTINHSIVSTTITPTGADAVDTVGGITKTGSGILNLTSANTYRGNTAISGGTLRLASTGSLQNTPRITVASSATFDVTALASGFTFGSGKTLEGGGQIQGNITVGNGAFLSPGTEGGDITQTLAFSSGLTLQSGSTTTLQLGTGSDYDRLIIGGSFLQEDGAKILISASSWTPEDGQVYQLFDFGGASSFSSNIGSFLRTGAEDNGTDFDLPDISSTGFYWNLSQLQSLGVVSIVPEPSKMLLALLGLGGLMMRRQRTKKH